MKSGQRAAVGPLLPGTSQHRRLAFGRGACAFTRVLRTTGRAARLTPMALAPDPKRLHGVIVSTKRWLDEFERGYASRYADVYGPGGGGLGRGGPVHESRPTELAAARAVKRSATLQAWAKALLGVNQAAKRLARATAPKADAPDNGPLDAYPPLISPEEHQGLVEARARREARGEG